MFSLRFLSKIQQCETAEDLTALQQDLGDWIAECGVPGIFNATVEDMPKIYAYVVKHYIFLTHEISFTVVTTTKHCQYENITYCMLIH